MNGGNFVQFGEVLKTKLIWRPKWHLTGVEDFNIEHYPPPTNFQGEVDKGRGPRSSTSERAATGKQI